MCNGSPARTRPTAGALVIPLPGETTQTVHRSLLSRGNERIAYHAGLDQFDGPTGQALALVQVQIVQDFGGTVPGTMDDLLQMKGVGRKTANVLLGECFDTPGIIVDTHCKRVTHRLGFTRNTDPDKIERDLMKIWAREDWTLFSHCIVFHGRAVCAARTPRCSECIVRALCPFPATGQGKKVAR